MAKSVLRAVVIDSEGEEFDYKARSMTGVKDLVDKGEDRLAADSGIPRTVLLGQSPTGGGLGSGGEHSSNNWNKFLESFQRDQLKDPITQLSNELATILKIDNKDLAVTFAPTWVLSEKEEAELRAKQAETDQKYIDMGVVDVSEVRQSRFGGDKYSIETKIDPINDIKLQEENDLRNNPPPPPVDPNNPNPNNPNPEEE